jgi:hypothetical protein
MRPAFLRISLTVLAACAAASLVALPGPGAPPACPAIDPPAAPAAPAAPGVRAFIDPATGKLRPPSAEQKRRIASAVRDRASRTYEVVVRPDGSRVVELDDTFSMSVVATTGADGAVQYRCIHRPAASTAEEK